MTWIETRFPGYYVDSAGRVLGRMGRVLKPGRSGKRREYLQVSCGKGNPQLVHMLVCEAFHGPRPVGQVVRHLNGVGSDNRASNLKWGTRQENEADKVLHGTFNHPRLVGESNGMAKLTAVKASEIRHRARSGEQISPLAREFGISRPVVAGIRDGNLWKEAA